MCYRIFLSPRQYCILLCVITAVYYFLCPNQTLKSWKRNYHIHCLKQVKKFIILFQTNDKIDGNKNVQLFLRFSICSVTKKSHNGGPGLTAPDYKQSREARARKSGCESCELAKVWRRLELLLYFMNCLETQGQMHIGSDATFCFPCLYSGKESVLCLLLIFIST